MNVVPLSNKDPIQKLVTEIRGHLYDAKSAEAKGDKHRLAAGQKLIELRRRVEAGEVGDGVDWWDWFETADIGRSRKDAERLMRIAGSDDPDAAHEREKQKAREGMQRTRAARGANVSSTAAAPPERSYDIVEHALSLVAKMSEEERGQFDSTYMEEYHG